jgi:hypothetical protein
VPNLGKKTFLNVFTVMPLAWAAFAFPLFAQRPVESGYQGSSYLFHSYRPGIIKKLNEVPSAVRAQLKSHLKERLGKSFYSKLEFDWGEKVDLAKLYEVEPYWKSERVATYSLIFHFSEKNKGLKAFYCRIGLDETGQVISEINLPKISEQPRKAKLIPSRDALVIASRNGFNPQSHPRLDYNDDTDSLVWIIDDGDAKLTEKLCHENALIAIIAIGQGPIGRIYIEAHTGRVLKTDCYRIIV